MECERKKRFRSRSTGEKIALGSSSRDKKRKKRKKKSPSPCAPFLSSALRFSEHSECLKGTLLLSWVQKGAFPGRGEGSGQQLNRRGALQFAGRSIRGRSKRKVLINPPPPRTAVVRLCFAFSASQRPGTRHEKRTRIPEVLLLGARDDAGARSRDDRSTSSIGLGRQRLARGEARGLHGQHGGGHRCLRGGFGRKAEGEDGCRAGGKRRGKRESKVKERELCFFFFLVLLSCSLSLSTLSGLCCSLSGFHRERERVL